MAVEVIARVCIDIIIIIQCNTTFRFCIGLVIQLVESCGLDIIREGEST